MYSLLLLSGGTGTRTNLSIPKQYVELNGVPMIIYTLQAIKDISEISEIIINYPEKGKRQLEDIIKISGLGEKIKTTSAGATRQESVYKMILASENEKIIIHEAARPLITKTDFKYLIDSEHSNCGYFLDIPFTVAPIDRTLHKVTGSIKRENIKNVQLPQKFLKSELKKAHEAAILNSLQYTEDSTLFVDHGFDFHILNGNSKNIKVTTPEDIFIAEHLIKHTSFE
jgi:2-C-methyl-D-erythritol 4-phosphate cytidylyltransferase